jgi:hypothetical protein
MWRERMCKRCTSKMENDFFILKKKKKTIEVRWLADLMVNVAADCCWTKQSSEPSNLVLRNHWAGKYSIRKFPTETPTVFKWNCATIGQKIHSGIEAERYLLVEIAHLLHDNHFCAVTHAWSAKELSFALYLVEISHLHFEPSDWVARTNHPPTNT